MRAGGRKKPEHDREQCVKLAKRKAQEAQRALGVPIALVERPVTDSLFRLEAPMDVFVKLGSRFNRNLPGPDRDSILDMVKVKLVTLLAVKVFGTLTVCASETPYEGPAPPERIIALLGEGLPVMLHGYEYMIATAIGFEGMDAQAKALVMLSREPEALAWMREYIPRFEAALNKPPALVEYMYDQLAKIHSRSKGDQADELPWRDWDEAERLSRKAVALAKGLPARHQ